MEYAVEVSVGFGVSVMLLMTGGVVSQTTVLVTVVCNPDESTAVIVMVLLPSAIATACENDPSTPIEGV